MSNRPRIPIPRDFRFIPTDSIALAHLFVELRTATIPNLSGADHVEIKPLFGHVEIKPLFGHEIPGLLKGA